MKDVRLGQKREIDNTQRDAIHIAIAPVVAAVTLWPGEHIGFVEPGSTELVGAHAKELIGIVDPFLVDPIAKGTTFWMLLYPQTITSLRHDWTHPAFVLDAAKAASVSARDKSLSQSRSEQWIRDWASGLDVAYQDMMDAAAAWVKDNECFSQGAKFDGENVPDEFWDHYQVVTGEFVANKGSFFSCSC